MPINKSGEVFNTTLFNGTARPTPATIRRVGFVNRNTVPAPPVVREDFTTTRPPTIQSVNVSAFNHSVSGPLALVRTHSVATLYGINFWDATEVRSPVQQVEDIDRLYTDFTLFNYLPVQLTPTKQQFATFINNTNNINTQNWGIDVVTTAVITVVDTQTPAVTIPAALAPVSPCEAIWTM